MLYCGLHRPYSLHTRNGEGDKLEVLAPELRKMSNILVKTVT